MHEFVRHIHFIGIGGIGMSGIAEVLLELKYEISGSDLQRSEMTDRLERAGAVIFIGHRADHIRAADAVVVSSAVAADNPEIIAAKARRIPLVPRAEMLGELMRFRKGIAIAGTHGKTTTTSLVSAVLAVAGFDPTLIVGGVVNSMRSNARLGRGEYLVAEADESDASFLHLQPTIAVVTNIDTEHLEAYGGDFDRLADAYRMFLHNLPFYGLAVVCTDDPAARKMLHELPRPTVSYGLLAGADFRAVEVRQQGRNCSFETLRHGRSLGRFELAMPGGHNVQNALAAIAVASHLEIDPDDMRAALEKFQGIGRRFDLLGEIAVADGRFQLVDDYAHHPTELSATLTAARACWPGRRLVTVFQPHRYTRTRDLFDDFARLLGGVDNLFVTEVYAAGEPPIAGSDGNALCAAIGRYGHAPVFAATMDELQARLCECMRANDVLLTLGAGDIGRFAHVLATAGQLQ